MPVKENRGSRKINIFSFFGITQNAVHNVCATVLAELSSDGPLSARSFLEGERIYDHYKPPLQVGEIVPH